MPSYCFNPLPLTRTLPLFFTLNVYRDSEWRSFASDGERAERGIEGEDRCSRHPLEGVAHKKRKERERERERERETQKVKEINEIHGRVYMPWNVYHCEQVALSVFMQDFCVFSIESDAPGRCTL